MKYPKLTSLFFFFWICYLLIAESYKEPAIDTSKYLENNIELEGVIESIKISRNHCFAILYVRNINANVPLFKKKKNGEYFPYSIKDGRSEFYTLVCNHDNIGDTLVLKSNDKLILLNKSSTENDSQQEIHMINEKTDIKFIESNSKIFK